MKRKRSRIIVKSLVIMSVLFSSSVILGDSLILLEQIPGSKTISAQVGEFGLMFSNEDIELLNVLFLPNANSISNFTLQYSQHRPNSGMRPPFHPILIYRFVITINYDGIRKEHLLMESNRPQPLYVKDKTGDFSNPERGTPLFYGQGLIYQHGEFFNSSGKLSGSTQTVYYIQSKCEEALNCIATVEYKNLGVGEYYTFYMLWEALQSVRDSLRSTQRGDLNGDGVVNIADFIILVNNFGK